MKEVLKINESSVVEHEGTTYALTQLGQGQ